MQNRSTHAPQDIVHQDPPEQFLIYGFRDVDGSGDAEAYRRCLDCIAGIPFFCAVKADSIRIIAGTEPRRVLDAGCGSGIDLVSLAAALPPECGIVGLDASRSFLSMASERTREYRDRCSLVRGDLLGIPFRDGSFDAARIDRVLQHIREPGRVVRELARVLSPGGVLVAFDNDWDTFRIELDDQDQALRLTRFFRDSFASGRVGRELAGLFGAAGLEEIRAEPRNLVVTDLPTAWQLFDLSALLHRTEAAGVLAPAEAAEVREELSRRAEEGRFTAGYTGCLVRGTKPSVRC
ncbi:SAM-dependent methyltransferase [Methanolinea mesophila]|uniref:methyltransferase domain-containing protein n=1 Tax=Methanolinea mesophila TaxID=547055 RepID=UPI001AEAEA95|nr:methyltransferase domain-containing protein [Methanolinea mesophila]MBP1927801.1 SAM-dependent methyltransferase [Methanolinea mesophila]